ncbi:unnamed protein product, partial [Pylaiella littoralis]
NQSVRSQAGQTRELIVKQAERVAHHTLVADLSEIEEKLSDDEHEYEAKAAKRQEEQRRKEEEIKQTAVKKVVSEASGQLSGTTLLDRMQGLAKLHASAKSAMNFELGRLTETRASAGKVTSADGGPSTSVHRHKVLKDEDLVPDDTVDNGEQDQVHEVLSEEGLDLSYLWMVNVNNLGPPSRPTSNTERSSNSATKGRGTIATTDGEQHQDSEDEGSGGVGGEVGAQKAQRSGSSDARENGGGGGKITRNKAGAGDEDLAAAKSAGDEPLVGSLEFGTGVEQGPTGGASDVLVGAKAKERADRKEGGDDGGGGGKGEQQRAKPRKGRLVPGSLVLTSLSATELPNTEKGLFSKQDPYLVVKWGEQEVRTSAKRDSGKDCSWPKEEFALIVRMKKQLQEPLEIEVWNDNAGDKKPSPDVLIGKAPLPVEHLALASPAALSGTTGGNGGDGGGGSRDNNTDDERGGKRVVLTVALVPSNGRTRKGKNAPGGVVTLTLAYTPPRRKPPKATKGQEEAMAKRKTDQGDQTATDTDEETLSSIAGLSALSAQGKMNHLSVQELGAAMSKALEGFDVRDELDKIGCLRYAQSIINGGFGQRGAFAHIQEEHLIGCPMFVPHRARKRLLALAELIRLQMTAEKKGVTTAIEARRTNGTLEGTFNRGYTVDGVTMFNTLAAMAASLEEDRVKAELAIASEATAIEEDLPPRPKSPKPRSAAKEKVDVWLDRADRFKNGAIPREAVKTVIRDALLLNGLPSPRESDVRLSLQHTSTDSQGLHFDRRKLGVELKHLIRNSLRTEYKE